jgi:ALG11 mannosyltransferase N-terminus
LAFQGNRLPSAPAHAAPLWVVHLLAFASASAFFFSCAQVFVDTTGWAFTYPLARLAGARVAAYVHYPTISADMLARVRHRAPAYNNDIDIAGSGAKSMAKLAYYYLFATLYGFVGGFANVRHRSSQ